jgi:predicted kinase
MRTIYLTVGLLGSGKSSWAREYVKTHPKVKIVSSDAIRQMLNGGYKYIPEMDVLISNMMVAMTSRLLNEGYEVIIDACNLTDTRRNKWLTGIGATKKVAVVFPLKGKKWHIDNRMKSPHCEGENEEYWFNVYESQRKQYQQVKREQFSEVINAKEPVPASVE